MSFEEGNFVDVAGLIAFLLMSFCSFFGTLCIVSVVRLSSISMSTIY